MNKKRIGIDVSLLKIKLAGMGIYVKELIELFAQIDHENEYFLFTNADLQCNLKLTSNFKIIKWTIKPHIVWLQLGIPLMMKIYKIQIFWQPDHILPVIKMCNNNYVTVHDLSAYKFHGIAMKRVELVYKLFLKDSCLNADKVIAISNYTKNDIRETFKIPEEKIKVIYNGDSPYKRKNRLKQDDVKKCLDKYNINKSYFMFVGTINPRKNIVTLIKAFELFRENKSGDAKLVLVGAYGWNAENVIEAIENSKFKNDIIKTGYVSEKEKEVLYRNSKVFVFPSILEGFGLPVLETMSIGVPVISSNVSSMPEVGGDAIFYYKELYDYKELGMVMDKVWNLTQKERVRVSENEIKRASNLTEKNVRIKH